MTSAGNEHVMLSVDDLHAYYGKSHILQGVSFDIREGEIVSLLGRNGVGRSTTCKTIIGEVAPSGSVRFKGKPIAGLKPHQIARLGIGYVPENRDVFPTLTVRQNLVLGQKSAKSEGRWRMADLFTLFPNLEARADVLGGALSGGEQQMLTMARTLMGDPDLMMIDEPTEGLAPQMVERIAALLTEIKGRGVAILLVEQKLTIALSIADRVYVMGHGRMVFEGTPDELRAADGVRKEWLEV
jgi:branched-chain amino acid transport system ATP-binding protein